MRIFGDTPVMIMYYVNGRLIWNSAEGLNSVLTMFSVTAGDKVHDPYKVQTRSGVTIYIVGGHYHTKVLIYDM